MKKKISIVLDIFIVLQFLWTFIAVQCNLFECDFGRWSYGIKFFKYFTNIGNLLLMISSIVSLILIISKKEKTLAFHIFRISAVTCTTVTFITVYCGLAQIDGWIFAFKFPDYLFEHTLIPLCAILQLFFFEDSKVTFKNRHASFCSIVPFTYFITWIICLLILNTTVEQEANREIVPYFFLGVHSQAPIITVLYALIALLAPSLIGLLFMKILNWKNKRYNKD